MLKKLDWINKLQRKFGNRAIHNLMMYIIICYCIGFVTKLTMPQMLMWFTLEPALILQGQIWRLISWILIPPGGGIFTLVIMSLLYYSLGNSLENAWGAFRFNVYIFSGILCTIIGAFILYFISGGAYGIGGYFSTYYINLSIFLAFAVSYPEMELLLYMVIPIKIKWLAILYAVMIGIQVLTGGTVTRVAIIASLFNFFVFYISTRKGRPNIVKQKARKAQYKKKAEQPQKTYENGAHHKCAVCGRTELDDPNLEFRYCSKCNGNYEYCQDHLFTHEHIK